MTTFPTHTTIDHHLTLDGNLTRGFPSGHLVLLVQAQSGVGATMLCERIAGGVERSVWFDLIGDYTPESPPHSIIRLPNIDVDDLHDTLMLVCRGARVVVVDSMLGVGGEDAGRRLAARMGDLHRVVVQEDSLLVVVTQEWGNGFVQAEGMWRNYASYIIRLSGCETMPNYGPIDSGALPRYRRGVLSYLAECVWSPVGELFEAEWTLPSTEV